MALPAPAKCVTVAEARQLQDNWKSTRAVEIESRMGVVDTREFVYSVAELEEFLNYVKSESLKQGFSSPGVRIYFGAYDNHLSDKATVFLAPTTGITSSSANNYNIQPLNMTGGGIPPTNY